MISAAPYPEFSASIISQSRGSSDVGPKSDMHKSLETVGPSEGEAKSNVNEPENSITDVEKGVRVLDTGVRIYPRNHLRGRRGVRFRRQRGASQARGAHRA